MDRRTFLRLLATGGSAAVAVATFGMEDPERFGWMPGKAFALPSPSVEPKRLDGWMNGTFLQEGDVITIAGYYAVNPPRQLQEFLVTGATSTSVDLRKVQIRPSVLPTGFGHRLFRLTG